MMLMLRTLLAAAAVALTSASSAGSAPASAQPETIDWSIQPGGSQSAGGKVQLTIESRWGPNSRSTWSDDGLIDDLSGLTAGQISGPAGPVRFALVRDAVAASLA